MKSIGVLILMILLLSGCAKPAAPEAAVPIPTDPSPAAVGVLTPGDCTPSGSAGALRDFSPEGEACEGLIPLGAGMVIIHSDKSALFLRYLDPETLILGPRLQTDPKILSPEAGLRAVGTTLSWFDPDAREMALWDVRQETVCRLPVPKDALGTPLLSPDGSTLYYCTRENIRALAYSTDISRILKEDPASDKTLAGLYLDGTVLRFDYQDPQLGRRCCYLRTNTGQLLWEGPADGEVMTWGDRYYASFPNGSVRSFVSGSVGNPPRLLLPAEKAEQCWFLPSQARAVTWEKGTLFCYTLPEGILYSRLTLPEDCRPLEFSGTGDGSIWFTAAQGDTVRLYRWSPEATAQKDGLYHSVLYHSAGDPDLEGLAACEKAALELGQRYGIHITVGEAAAAAIPPVCKPEPELQVHILTEALQNLEGWLERYPPGYLRTLADRGSGLTLCLVRSISAPPGTEDMETVPGFHFWQDTRAVIVLPIGDGMEGALYHQLYHLADTVVLGRSGAYDSWDSLNPGDFSYDYDYAANRQRQSPQFLREHSRSFTDTYAMSFPVEDRARLLEFAMLPGNQALFDAPILQQKLTALCTGLREAFNLEAYPDPLPWEQYLHTPLV